MEDFIKLLPERWRDNFELQVNFFKYLSFWSEKGKPIDVEDAAVRLVSLSDGDIEKAIWIVKQSIDKGWNRFLPVGLELKLHYIYNTSRVYQYQKFE